MIIFTNWWRGGRGKKEVFILSYTCSLCAALFTCKAWWLGMQFSGLNKLGSHLFLHNESTSLERMFPNWTWRHLRIALPNTVFPLEKSAQPLGFIGAILIPAGLETGVGMFFFPPSRDTEYLVVKGKVHRALIIMSSEGFQKQGKTKILTTI